MSTRRPPITPISTHGSVVWSADNFPLANLADANPSSISIATCDPATCDVSSADLSSVFLAVRVPAGLPIGHVQVTNRPTYREYSFETATVPGLRVAPPPSLAFFSASASLSATSAFIFSADASDSSSSRT